MPGVFDHLLAGLLLVAWPIWVAYHGREGLRELAGDPSKRQRGYRITIAVQWIHFLVIAGLWWALDRPWTDLGLGLTLNTGFAIAAVLTVAGAWVMWSQWRRALRDPAFAASLRGQMKDLEMEGFMPESRSEVRDFRALAVTAGICEELAYRGFLLWYLTGFMHVAPAIALMAVAFGAGHLYQGRRAAAQIAGIGVAAALFYLVSGSLWIPMLLHALLDLSQLAMVRAAFRKHPGGNAAPSAA